MWMTQKASCFLLASFLFCYQFSNIKTGKVTKFGLNTIRASKIMQKKPAKYNPPPRSNRVNNN